jgi:hypothetical protein
MRSDNIQCTPEAVPQASRAYTDIILGLVNIARDGICRNSNSEQCHGFIHRNCPFSRPMIRMVRVRHMHASVFQPMMAIGATETAALTEHQPTA